MPQSSTANILPIFNQELSNKSKPSGYNWKTLTKASLVFVTTTGAFLALKTTRSFGLITSWWRNSPSETNLDESSALANFNNPSTQTYIAPASEEQTLITHQYTKRQPSDNETVIKTGPEFQVNTYTTGYQAGPSITQLNDGKFVVVWHSIDQDGDGYGIYGQIYNANGTTYGSEFQVNTYTTSQQCNPSIARLNDVKFVVTWESNGQDGDGWGVFSQMFNTNGNKYSSEFQMNTCTTSSQAVPSIAGLNDGKFVVTWASAAGQDGDLWGIYAQLFNADGSIYFSEFRVNTYTTGDQNFPSVAKLGDGKFVVIWTSSTNIYGQLFNTDGSKYDSEFQVNTYTISLQVHPSAAGLIDGKFVATWTSIGQDGDGDGVYGQLFNADGSMYSSEFQVNTHTTSSQTTPSVAGLSDGKFVVTWWSSDQDGSGYGVYGQLFNTDGTKYLSEFQVNTYTTSAQNIPSATGLSDGKFVVTWLSNGQDGDLDGIFGQLFKIDTAPILVNNNLTIGKGERITLTTNDLSATDVDDDDAALNFTVNDVQHGQFELKSNPGILIVTFTQQQIIDGDIQFVHDDSANSPSYDMAVNDGSLSTSPVPAVVTFSFSESLVSSGSESKVISSGSPISQSAIQSESSTSTSRSTSKSTTSSSISSIASEASSRISTPTSSSEFSLSSESKTLSSSPSTTESASSRTSKSEMPSSTSSAYQSTMQSKTSASVPKSTSKEVSSTQALSGSSNSATTTSKSFLGTILGSTGGVVSAIGSIFGIWLKYKKHRAIIKLRQQSPLAAEVQRHLNLDVSDFQSKQGQKYVAVINGIVEALQKQGTPVEEMDKEQLHNLTLSSVEIIKKEVEPNRTFLRKTIPVKGLKNAKDSIIKGVINKYVKGKNKNGIMLQSIKSEEADIEEKVCESEERLFGVKNIQKIQPDDLKFEKDKIGDGSFGDVYKATWQGSEVAVKVLKEGIADLPEFMGDFIREAATWSKLTHPNITRFFGICWTNPSPYIVVEYVGGGSLASHLKQKDLPLIQRFGLALDTIRGLKYLHEYNPSILHRDIKPDNILVEYNWDQSNGQWLLRGKVTDFGTARQKVIDRVEQKQQKLTKGVGTPIYQAPEIMQGSQDYSEKADIYSVGICLCEIYTQQEPYIDHDELTTQFKLCKAVVEGVRPTIPDEMPKGYAKLIKRCWSERSDKRPNARNVEQQLNTIVMNI